MAKGPNEVPVKAVAQAVAWGELGLDGPPKVGGLGYVDSACNVLLRPDALFDIASVTKLFTATLAMIAHDRGLLRFDDDLGHVFPEMTGLSLASVLNHTSGLDAWRQWYLELDVPVQAHVPDLAAMKANRERILQDILESERKPPGQTYAYSDLGYILLGRCLEEVFGQRLDDLVRVEICEPLGLKHTSYVNLLNGELPLQAVPTERCPVRGASTSAALSSRDEFERVRHLPDESHAVSDPTRGKGVEGVVHDENAWIQGGVCGHAGLFSNVEDLLAFGAHFLAIFKGDAGIIRAETLAHAWDRKHLHPQGHHVLGWDTPSGERTSVGRGFSRTKTYGHLGFTGTSLWLDLAHETVAVLLTNRVYPTRNNPGILDLRIAFHEAVLNPESP